MMRERVWDVRDGVVELTGYGRPGAGLPLVYLTYLEI